MLVPILQFYAPPKQQGPWLAVLWCAGAEWPHITCCQDANLQQRVCGLMLPGMGLTGGLPAIGLSAQCGQAG